MNRQEESLLWAAYIIKMDELHKLFKMPTAHRQAYMMNVEGSFTDNIIEMIELDIYGTYFINYVNHLLQRKANAADYVTFVIWNHEDLCHLQAALEDENIYDFQKYIHNNADSITAISGEYLLFLYKEWKKLIIIAKEGIVGMLISCE